MPSDIRIVIVDDHELYRRGLRQVITEVPHLKLVAEADDYDSALRCLQTTAADVVILDIALRDPDRNGYAIARAMRAQHIATEAIILTGVHQSQFFDEAMSLGVKGYVLKDRSFVEILEAIHAVAAGLPYISPVLSPLMLEHHTRTAALRAERPSLATLTPTERQVLLRVADNQTSKQIAEEFGVALRTIENHRMHICVKLDLHGPHMLLPFAVAHRAELE